MVWINYTLDLLSFTYIFMKEGSDISPTLYSNYEYITSHLLQLLLQLLINSNYYYNYSFTPTIITTTH